ncbi:hypothetical protein GCM10028777_32310 [Angustibacter speluncae]
MPSRLPSPLVALLAAVAAAATWFAWLGWESGYVTDPATGTVTGPYSVVQVAGCVVTLLVVAAVAGWFAAPWWVAPAITLAFTAAWTVDAAASDDSGLFVVGAGLVLVGLALGSGLVCTGAWLLARRGRRALAARRV